MIVILALDSSIWPEFKVCSNGRDYGNGTGLFGDHHDHYLTINQYVSLEMRQTKLCSATSTMFRFSCQFFGFILHLHFRCTRIYLKESHVPVSFVKPLRPPMSLNCVFTLLKSLLHNFGTHKSCILHTLNYYEFIENVWYAKHSSVKYRYQLQNIENERV